LPISRSGSRSISSRPTRSSAVAAGAAFGCGTVNLFANGFSGATVAQTAEQAGFRRHDTRSIAGLRWEHDLDNQTTWRTQAVFDDKNDPATAI
jgi:iron complex outermembrane receptor protein